MIGYLIYQDLLPLAPGMSEAEAQVLIEDVTAAASRAAPCLKEIAFYNAYHGEVRGILRQAALRWYESGPGGSTTSESVSAGPFGQSVSHTVYGGGRLLKSERVDLAKLCREYSGKSSGGRAFSVTPGWSQ